MKYLQSLICILLLVAAGCDTTSLAPSEDTAPDIAFKQAPVGFVGVVADYDLPTTLEGIAFDRPGNMYVTVRNAKASRIDQITPTGDRTTYAVLPKAVTGAGALGLIVSPKGTVYAALPTGDPDTQGVYRIPRGGAPERVPGSEGMEFPNALAFDAEGNLYATNSFGPASGHVSPFPCGAPTQCGSIWRYEPGGTFSMWLTHPLIDSAEFPGAPFAAPGANGIAYYESDDVSPTLYVANTSLAMIVRVPLNPDGTAGAVSVHAVGFDLIAIDGIAVDVDGNLYAGNGVANAEEIGAPPAPALTKVLPDGTIEALVPFEDRAPFDVTTSLAFSSGPRSRKSLFVVNSALYGPIPGSPGPGVVEVNVGVPGFQTR